MGLGLVELGEQGWCVFAMRDASCGAQCKVGVVGCRVASTEVCVSYVLGNELQQGAG